MFDELSIKLMGKSNAADGQIKDGDVLLLSSSLILTTG